METNHRTRWTQEENDLLEALWDPTAVEVVAEVFGRTVEAVRQHHYELSWGTAPKAPTAKDVTTKTHVTSTHHRRQTVTERPIGKVCQSCWVELPLVGDCSTCS